MFTGAVVAIQVDVEGGDEAGRGVFIFDEIELRHKGVDSPCDAMLCRALAPSPLTRNRFLHQNITFKLYSRAY